MVYTQLTDVETEINGLMTYDRVSKVDPALIARATHFEYPNPTYQEVVPTSEKTAQNLALHDGCGARQTRGKKEAF